MTAREWIDAYADALGVEAPDEARVAAILRLAAEAAHASERVAAPVACWLAASAGLEPEAALARAEGLRG
jgi:hypothetical protein